MWEREIVVRHRRRGDSCLEGCVWLIDEGTEFFEALNNTRFALPQSKISEKSEVRRSVASLRDLFTS